MNHRLKQIQKLARLALHPDFRRGVRHGVGASVEHTAALRNLSLSTVVDVGANVGQFSLLAVALFPRVHVEAFEPLSAPAGVFRRLFAGDPRVNFHQVAIGPVEQTVTMHVSRRHDSSSVLPITDLQARHFPGTERAGKESVQMSTLDSAIDLTHFREPALLKLDVQGFELQALKGSTRVLRRCEYVYVELSFVELYEGQALGPEVTAFLTEENFRMAGVYNVACDTAGRAIQCDAMFKAAPDRAA